MRTQINRGVKNISVPQGGVISSELSIPAGTKINFNNHAVSFAARTYNAIKVTGNNVEISGLNLNAGGHRGITASGVSGLKVRSSRISNTSIGIRADGGGSGHVYDGITIASSANDGIETYGLTGFSINNIRGSDHRDGSTVQINASSNGTIGSVNGTRAGITSGRAALRIANNSSNITVGSVTSNGSGRGLFILTGSKNITVNNVNLRNSRLNAILIQGGSNNVVRAGTYSGNAGIVIQNSPGSNANGVRKV